MKNPIIISVTEQAVDGFNYEARNQLKRDTDKFVTDLIKEAHRLEENIHTTEKKPEITSSIISNANFWLRNNLSKPKPRPSYRILKVISNILWLIVGILFQTEKLQKETNFFIFFIFLLAFAIILSTISVLNEN